MNDKVTIITAFFPIKRENWTGFERDNKKYLQYFEFWARIKNDLVIYTTPEAKDEIEKLRKEKFNLKNTQVITIDDITSIDKELYNSIVEASSNELSKSFRIEPSFPESWNPNYNYVVMLKEWCIYDAINNGYAKGTILWLDFGFNHGGEYYTNANDFNFMLHPFENIPLFETIRRMDTYVQGNILIGPDYLFLKLWPMMRNNMIALNKLGLMDDDQTLLQMCYMENKDMFELIDSKIWFYGLRKITDNNFQIAQLKQKSFKMLRFLKRKLKRRLKIYKYCKKNYNLLKKREIKG